MALFGFNLNNLDLLAKQAQAVAVQLEAESKANKVTNKSVKANTKIEQEEPKSAETETAKQTLTARQTKDTQVNAADLMMHAALAQIGPALHVVEADNTNAERAFEKIKKFTDKLTDDKNLDKYLAQKGIKGKKAELFKTRFKAQVDTIVDRVEKDNSYDHRKSMRDILSLTDERRSPLARRINEIVASDENLAMARSDMDTALIAYTDYRAHLVNDELKSDYKRAYQFATTDRYMVESQMMKDVKAHPLSEKEIKFITARFAVCSGEGDDKVCFLGKTAEEMLKSDKKLAAKLRKKIDQTPGGLKKFVDTVRNDPVLSRIADEQDEKLDDAVAPDHEEPVLSEKVKDLHLLQTATSDETALKIAKGEDIEKMDALSYLLAVLQSKDNSDESLLDEEGNETELASELFDDGFLKAGGLKLLVENFEAKQAGSSEFFYQPLEAIVANFNKDRTARTTVLGDYEHYITEYDFDTVEPVVVETRAELPEDPIDTREEVLAKQHGISEVEASNHASLVRALKRRGYNYQQIAHIVGDIFGIAAEIKRQINIPLNMPVSMVQDIISRVLNGESINSVMMDVLAELDNQEIAQDAREALHRINVTGSTLELDAA